MISLEIYLQDISRYKDGLMLYRVQFAKIEKSDIEVKKFGGDGEPARISKMTVAPVVFIN